MKFQMAITVFSWLMSYLIVICRRIKKKMHALSKELNIKRQAMCYVLIIASYELTQDLFRGPHFYPSELLCQRRTIYIRIDFRQAQNIFLSAVPKQYRHRNLLLCTILPH